MNSWLYTTNIKSNVFHTLMEKINIPHDLCHISHQLSRLGKFVFHLSSDIRCIDEINIVENSVLDRTGGTILKREDYKIRFILVDVWHGCFLTYYYRYTTGQVLLCFLPADTMPISDYRSNLPFQFCNVWYSVICCELGLWCLTTLSTIFQLYHGGQFYWWRKPIEYHR